jgi:two-component system NtrC family sensor kinase
VPSDINRLLDDVVRGLKEREFAVSNVELVRDYDTDLTQVMLDADQMRQVFLNLINNAGDAIDGQGTITLSTRSCDGFVRATVTDTGCGMPPELMERIFVPFFTTKETGKGTGLGLSISLNIVEGMGGRLHVQSVPGAGSSFIIDLPVDKPQGDNDGGV